MNTLESKMRRMAASLDAKVLEALASRGLLRRAQKDLDRGIEIHIGAGAESTLRLRVGEFAVTQVFMWTLADSQQRPLHIEIGFEEFTEPAIKFLEDVPPESLQGALVIGRIQRTPQGLSLHPYSIHRQSGQIIHLCLDNVMPAAARANSVQNEEEESFEDEEETELPTAFSPALSRLLDEVDDGLLVLAEAGLATPNPLRVERVRQVALRAERLGLQGLTSGLSNVANHPRSVAVLRCAYLSQLHRRAMSLSV